MSDQDVKQETQEHADQANEQEAKPLFTIGDREYDADAAQKKIVNADGFIEQLKTESKEKDAKIAELQAQLDQAAKLEDALEQLKAKEHPQEESNMAEEASVDNTNPTGLDLEELKQSLLQEVTSHLTAKDQKALKQKNQQESIQAAQDYYGSDYENKLREKAKSMGMSDEDIVAEAQANPKKFKALFGLNKEQKSSPSPFSTQQSTQTKQRESSLDFSPKLRSADKMQQSISNMQAMAKKLGVEINL